MLKLKQIIFDKKKYKIFYRYKKHDPAFDNSLTYGYIDHELEGIIVRKSLPASKKLQVLLHEIFHMIEDGMGLSFTEDEIDSLSVGLLKFLNQNGLKITKTRIK